MSFAHIAAYYTRKGEGMDNIREYWTIADVMAENPCLAQTVIQRHFGTADRLTLQQILELPALSDEHKVWMACRPNALAVDCYQTWQTLVLTRAITRYALPHASTAEWAQRWLNGERDAAEAARAAWDAGAAGAAWDAEAAEAARAARAAEATWAARAAGAAEAAEAARAARAAEATWAARAAGAAGAAGAARAAGAAWAARVAEYTQQLTDLKGALNDFR